MCIAYGYLDHKRICGMCVRTDVRTYVQKNCSIIHASVGLAQARPNYIILSIALFILGITVFYCVFSFL